MYGFGRGVGGSGGGGGGLPIDSSAYAEITLTDNVVATTLTTQNTWYQILPVAWGNDQTPVRMTINGAAGTITTDIASTFATNCTLAFTTGASANTLQFAIFKDGVQIVDHKAITWIDSSTYPNTVTITGIDALAIGNVLDVRVRCTTAAGIAIIVTDANFSVFSVTGASVAGVIGGSGASGQVTLWNGATSITGDAGCTWTGTGASFVQTAGYGFTSGAGTATTPAYGFSAFPGYGVFLASGTALAHSGALALQTKAGGISLWNGASTAALSVPSAGLLLVEDGSGAARDLQARTGTFGTSVVTPVVSGGAGDITTDGTTYNIFKTGGVTRGYFDSTNFYLSSTGMLADGRILTATGTVSPYLVSGPGKSGTNVAGTNNVIQSEPGTGSATGSSIVFQTSTAGASGTTGQTQTTRLTINETAATFGGGIVAGGSAFQVSSAGFVNGSGFTIYGSIGGATGKINIASDGVFSSNGDVGISRAAAATFVVGNGTAGDATGTLKAATLVSTGTVRLQGYTVATLPAGTVGDTAYVTDATAPTYNAALTGGGAVTIPVFYNGAAWVSH